MKTALVTGASGFIGTHLCRRLLKEGYEVNALTRAPRWQDDPREVIHWYTLGLEDLPAVRDIVNWTKPDYIFHLASKVSGIREIEATGEMLSANFISAFNLLTVATGHCERLVMAGSCDEPVNGDVPCSPYAAAKFASTNYARMFHALYGTPVVVPRIFMTYGPEQQDETKLVPYVIQSLLRGESPKLSSGRRLVDWIYVEDVVEGLMRSATLPGLAGTTPDLGSGRLVSIEEIARLISELVGGDAQPEFGALPDRPMEQSRVANMWPEFGTWQRKSLREGLTKTVDYYRRRTPFRTAENCSKLVPSS